MTTREETKAHMDMLIAHKDKALETYPYFKRCDSCIHSEEQDGSNCYECVKGMGDNFEAQSTDKCKGCYYNDGETHAECVVCDKKAQPTDEDCISREAMLSLQTEYAEKMDATTFWKLRDDIRGLPPVKPKYTDEEIDKAQAVEQAYVDKMVELAVEEAKRPKGKWIDIRVIKSFHYDGEPRVRCSRCGNEEEWSSNYCPNCGAEMSGGGEDEVSN